MQAGPKTIRELAALQPDVIGGYPSVLAHIALYQAERDHFNNKYRFILSGGESLPPFRRRTIEQGFGRRVFDIYGSHEFNLLAWQCRDSGWYHICDDNVILEVLRNGRPAAVGERAEVVATGLHGYAMPFIRYRLGDIVTRGPETCPCGQPFSTLGAIQGRMHDYFRFSNGRLIHPHELIIPMMEDDSSWLDRYRLVQEKENRVVLWIQSFCTPDEGQLNRVKKMAEKVLPAEVEFHVNIVKNLPVEPSGKFRICRSMVNSDCDDINWQDL